MRTLLIATILLVPALSQADLRVFTCEPEWAALVEAFSPQAEVRSATTARQDVHYIQARPSLISAVRRADLVICTGSDLEVGWLPLLLRQGANRDVQPGGPGFLEASAQVERLEVPEKVDRSQGDVHPFGNPHVQLDPRRVRTIARAIAERLAELDPDAAAGIRSRHADWDARWAQALERWQERARPLAGMEVVTHHRSWIYLHDWLGLVGVDNLEPKPGIPPTTGHLAGLLKTLESRDVRAIIRSAYQDPRASEWLSGRTGVPAVVLPHTVGATDAAEDLFAVYEDIIDRLLAVRGEAG